MDEAGDVNQKPSKFQSLSSFFKGVPKVDLQISAAKLAHHIDNETLTFGFWLCSREGAALFIIAKNPETQPRRPHIYK
jgi:hypothetical protein